MCLMYLYNRSRRSLESKQNMDDDKMTQLEEQLRIIKAGANESERKFEEVVAACDACSYIFLLPIFRYLVTVCTR